MVKVLIPGTRVETEGADTDDSDQPFATYRVQATRDGQPPDEETLPENHVVEVTLEDGIVLYRRAEDLQKQSELRGFSENMLPMSLTVPTRDRGAGRYLVRLYRFFKGKSVTDAAVQRATERIEAKLEAPDTLFRCRTPSELRETGPLEEGQRMLLLLHGTFSNTEGSFGNLAQTGAMAPSGHWRRLTDAFAKQGSGPADIFAFEHRSVSKSPLENATALIDQLPRDARIDMLSHSRGGLIGEILCRAAREGAGLAGSYFDDRDAQIVAAKYKADDAATVRKQLEELERKLIEKRLQINSFVRVACPMRGTLLASDRLDLYLSVFLNLLSLAPGPQQTFVSAFSSFVRAVVGARTDPRVLPGLEAMMPDSAHVALLNRQDLTVTSPLDIVGGDIEAGGILRSLAVFASDLFFREEHDLVVNTSAMFGGAPRKSEPRALVSRGSSVAHFSYFRNGDSLDRIVNVLTGELEVKTREPVPTLESVLRRSRDDRERPAAILVPGIMGSTLTRGDDLIWVDPFDMVFGGISRIGADAHGNPAADVRSTGVVEKYYLRLAQHVARTHQTMIRQYDWRLSIDEAADVLNKTVDDALAATESSKQPVSLICHSMGGLVARRMIVKHPDTWRRMHDGRTGSRVIMLGTPNGGSASMAAGLIGHDKMIRQLALVDVKNDLTEIIASILPLPGILELLPTDEDFAFFEKSTWDALKDAAPKGWAAPSQAALDRAKVTWQGMEISPSDVRHFLYIAGQAPATVTAIRPEPFALLATPNGDGRVTWATGMMPGAETWYAPGVVHGDLARNRRLFAPITDLLLRGTTDRLPRTPPVSRDAETLFELTEEPVIYPSGEDFDLLPMGGTPDAELVERAEVPLARVTIEHGDLRLQPGTVAVGHYSGAPLLSAEKSLDATLGGALRIHQNAGIYPGNIGSSELFTTDDPNKIGPDAALVVGLGKFGELGPQDLKTTLMQAFIRFALKSTVQPRPRRKLTSLLIGHQDSRINVRESIRAILEALQGANRRVPERMRIRELTILEVFEDCAIEASEALSAFSGHRFPDLSIDPRLREGRAGRQRQTFSRNRDWEMMVEITSIFDENGPAREPSRLRFQVMNGSALVDSVEATINLRSIHKIVREVQTTRNTNSDIGRLLFLRLIPFSIRRILSEGSNVVLILDQHTASYPWELIVDREDEKPIAIRTKMVRQLIQGLRPERALPSATDLALVIGDPASDYAELPNALKEAQNVETRLRASSIGDVVTSYRKDPRLEDKIFLKEARILHFAGHGIVDGGPDKNITGLVIGRDDYLTAADIRQMDTVPEFVFLNCCHVGRIPPEMLDEYGEAQKNPEIHRSRSELAANIAVAFMRRGSKAVIAAGWAIDDTNAQTFAETFYDRFLAGDTLAEAVEAARDRAYSPSTLSDDRKASEPTWGAYQCYGDSHYRLRTLGGQLPSNDFEEDYTARSQVLAVLQEIRTDARFIRDQSGADSLLQKLRVTERAVEAQPEWMRSPEVLEALGRAMAEVGNRDQAIVYLDEAAQASPPRVSIETVELRDALFVRKVTEERRRFTQQAAEALDAAKRKKADAKTLKALKAAQAKEMEKLIEHEKQAHTRSIEALEHHQRNAAAEDQDAWRSSGAIERQIRLGDTHLRYAAALISLGDKKGQTEQLKLAEACYEQAENHIGGEDSLSLAYARLRRVAAEYFLPQGRSSVYQLHVVDSVVASLRADDNARPVFERELRLAEAELLLFLVEGSSEKPRHDTTVESFMRAFLAGATVGQREETINDLEVLARLLDGAPGGENAATSVRSVARDLRRRGLMQHDVT